jgi:hypothetical protein
MKTKYVVVKYGDLNRGEYMNIAIAAWEDAGPTAQVHWRFLQDWRRIDAAFPKGDAVKQDTMQRLIGIRTKSDYDTTLRRMGPYTPFEFAEEMPSITTPEDTLESLAKFFLVEPK